ncbi:MULTISPECIES: hypothetical protein [Rubrivivax]|uniref:Secreted protein n=1 Tax=Rubrivivax gelatinosus TaxID=28068 RepID=A0ABS1DRT1_RUBGE|nr:MULTISPECIES: hypothetical protein [Rubrivivax]MBK1712158.1 hypothetical protein [Rubrivivax gelatinosus]MCC9597975.1 hypothetical protein [Rubrivivax sp. JA1055]MCC9645768.1 hypothetical protein [Rubrivivax sp. JA1029]
MKRLALFVLLAGCSAAAPALAQYVKGNEAVRSGRAETPPLLKSMSRMPACAADAGCHAGPWHMVETADGLRECTEPTARPGTCRPSSYGSRKLARLWVVKRGTTWQWCQYPDMGSRCVDMHARPPANLLVAVVQ